MAPSEDSLIFADEDQLAPAFAEYKTSKWKLLVVDDEVEIHSVTKMALEGLDFDNKGLEFISAYSGYEAIEKLKAHNDIAVILLDVVMEENDSGLKATKRIREELKNKEVRIILRTGQPGQAPERMVIRDYDINDYKTKTELTSQKLMSSVYSALRSYRDIVKLSSNRAALEKIVAYSASIFELKTSTKQFMSMLLQDLISLLNVKDDKEVSPSFIASKIDGVYKILSGTGRYSNKENLPVGDLAPEEIIYTMELAESNKKSIYSDGDCLLYIPSKKKEDKLVYVENAGLFEYVDKDLLEVFGSNVSIAFDNILLNEEIKKTEREIVYAMGTIAETRSKETGNHVKRVAEYSKILSRGIGLSSDEVELIRLASPLHDIGKIGIPDEVLNKPGKHEPHEWEKMKTHAQLGYEMLKNVDTAVLQSGAIISLQHHEKWDGNGYPQGLKGKDIHMYGRITAVADVFDALGSDRCYKKAWELDRILELFKAERGKHFDPELVDLFFEKLDEFLKARDSLKD